MTWENSAITIATLLPLVGALVIALVPREQDRAVRALGIVFTGAAMVVAIALAIDFDYGAGSGLQFELDTRWIPAIDARYHVGIDGISLPLYVLTFVLSFLCAIYTWRFVPKPGKTKAFIGLMLLLETGMAGTFIAFDLILFFVFWELVLVPMYFLIGIWGSANREYAAIKFFLFTLFGSIFMLLGFLGMYFSGPDPHTFDMLKLQEFAQGGGFSNDFQLVVFGAVALGLAVKVPMWPVHTWLPDAHTEAPTGGSVVLAAILLKLGAYGFVRFTLPILPDASRELAWLMIALSLVAIAYIGLVTLVQTDMKRLIAYSSVSHMGFVTLGFFIFNAYGVEGGLVQMISHGFVSAAMFLCVGVLYDRMHTRMIGDYGGVVNTMPKFASFMMLFAMANAGLPATSGFVGEFMVILGAMKANFWLAFIAATTLVWGAGYTLWMYKRVIFGAVANDHVAKLQDINGREFLVLALLAAAVLWMGVYPAPFTEIMHASVNDLLKHIAVSKL